MESLYRLVSTLYNIKNKKKRHLFGILGLFGILKNLDKQF